MGYASRELRMPLHILIFNQNIEVMKVSLDIKNKYGKLYTKEIMVKDQNHLDNYLAKANRNHSDNK